MQGLVNYVDVTKHFVSRFSISEWRCKRYVGDVTRVAVRSLEASLHITRVLVIDPYAADYVQLPADVDVGPEFGATLVHVDASKTDKFTFRTRDVTTTYASIMFANMSVQSSSTKCWHQSSVWRSLTL